MVNEAQILHMLRMVVDPEIGVNIVDLGLVYKVDIQDQAIHIDLTMTSPTCPLHHVITSEAKTLLKRKFENEIKTVDIRLVWEPPWNPEMMSSAARRQLGW
ncbi:MAG: metal-sulfur cluster assembly factor [Chloroflexota bacterium]